MQKKVLSLVGFKQSSAIQEYLDEFPDMYVELSYKMDKEFLEEVAPLLTGRVASVHACCPLEPTFPNFGSYDTEVLEASFTTIEKSFKTAQRFGADILVLHPGYSTDFAIPSDNQRRKELLDDPSFHPYIFKEEGSISSPSYPDSPVYQKHFLQTEIALVRVAQMGKKYGVRLAAENLNPRVGYLCQTPQDMISLIQGNPDLSICLDVGHLWISSCLYGFDYFAAIQTLLDTGRVITCHLHSNSSQQEAAVFADDHHSLDKHNFPYEQVLTMLQGTGANLVLETIENPRENTLLLSRLLIGENSRPEIANNFQ